MQNARWGIPTPNRVAQGIRTSGGSWPHTGIVGATSGIAPGVTPVSAIILWLRSAVGERGNPQSEFRFPWPDACEPVDVAPPRKTALRILEVFLGGLRCDVRFLTERRYEPTSGRPGR